MRISDWSSDVCSSDLRHHQFRPRWGRGRAGVRYGFDRPHFPQQLLLGAFKCGTIFAGQHYGYACRTEAALVEETYIGHVVEQWSQLLLEGIQIGRASCRERVCQYV